MTANTFIRVAFKGVICLLLGYCMHSFSNLYWIHYLCWESNFVWKVPRPQPSGRNKKGRASTYRLLPPLFDSSWLASPSTSLCRVEHTNLSVMDVPSLYLSKPLRLLAQSIPLSFAFNFFVEPLQIRLGGFSFDWVTSKSYVELFLMGILVLNHDTSLAHRLLKPKIEPDSRLLYQARVDLLRSWGGSYT